MTHKTGRVTKLSDVKGVVEYRFVPQGWICPIPQLAWYEFDPVKHADVYAQWQADIVDRAARMKLWTGQDWDFTATWLHDGQTLTSRIDFHPVERPVLVVIGGLL